ncbi:MAG: response regulator [Lachnospiraceae bacterium]
MSFDTVKIIIIDDSILARKQLKDVLFQNGISLIVEGSNGQEAVDLYKEHHPDLVFLDIVMPVKSGNDAIKEIKEFDPDANIIIVSSVGTQTELRHMIEAGAKEFIQKPFQPDQISQILTKLFEGRS